MNKFLVKFGWVIALIIAIIAIFVPSSKKTSTVSTPQLSGQTNYSSLKLDDSSDQLKIYSSGISVKRFEYISSMATSSVCSILSPSATSTLLSYTFVPTVGTSTASNLYLATSTTQYATTSLIASLTASSYIPTKAYSWSAGTNNSVVDPNTYVNLSLAALTAYTGGYNMSGSCVAMFFVPTN